MHICPQEIIMIIGSIETLKPAMWMLKNWCESCVNGTHKSCEDHAADKALITNDKLSNQKFA